MNSTPTRKYYAFLFDPNDNATSSYAYLTNYQDSSDGPAINFPSASIYGSGIQIAPGVILTAQHVKRDLGVSAGATAPGFVQNAGADSNDIAVMQYAAATGTSYGMAVVTNPNDLLSITSNARITHYIDYGYPVVNTITNPQAVSSTPYTNGGTTYTDAYQILNKDKSNFSLTDNAQLSLDLGLISNDTALGKGNWTASVYGASGNSGGPVMISYTNGSNTNQYVIGDFSYANATGSVGNANNPRSAKNSGGSYITNADYFAFLQYILSTIPSNNGNMYWEAKSIFSQIPTNLLLGVDANQTITMLFASQIVVAGNGTTTICGSSGDNTILGGSGLDILDYTKNPGLPSGMNMVLGGALIAGNGFTLQKKGADGTDYGTDKLSGFRSGDRIITNVKTFTVVSKAGFDPSLLQQQFAFQGTPQSTGSTNLTNNILDLSAFSSSDTVKLGYDATSGNTVCTLSDASWTFSSFDKFVVGNYTVSLSANGQATISQTSGTLPVITGSNIDIKTNNKNNNTNVVVNGNKDTVLSNGGDTINTGTGTGDILFTSRVAGSTDAGTNFVISPSISTIVGGGANDRLVLLADRLWSSSSGTPTDASAQENSATITLTGGIGNQPGAHIGPSFVAPALGYWYYRSESPASEIEAETANTPSIVRGGYDYSVDYIPQMNSDGSVDLGVSITALDPTQSAMSGKYILWNGSVLIKNYHTGDFGLKFIVNTAYANYINGVDTNADDMYASENKDMTSLVSSPVVSNSANDDHTVGWNGVVMSASRDPGPTSDADIQKGLVSVAGISNITYITSTAATTLASSSVATIASSLGTSSTPLQINGNSATINVVGYDVVSVSGENNVVSASSDGNAISDTSGTDTGDIVTLLGAGNSVTFNGSKQTAIVGGTNSVAYLNGSNDTVSLTGTSDGTVDAGSQNVVNLNATGNWVTLYGATSSISDAAGGSWITLYGNNESVNATSAGDTIVVDGTSSTSGASQSVQLQTYKATININGANDTVSSGGTSNTISVQASSDGVVEFGNMNSIAITATYTWETMYGAGSSIDDTAGSSWITLYGNNETVTSTEAGDTINVVGTSTTAGGPQSVQLQTYKATININGENDTTSSGGTGNSINVQATTDGVVEFGNNNSIMINADYTWETMYGASSSLTDNGNLHSWITLYGGNETVTTTGKSDTINVFGTGASINATGDDTSFVLNAGFTSATISGFLPTGNDIISLASTEFANFADVIAHASNSGSDTVIASHGDTLTLRNVSVSSLASSNFSFHS